MTSDTTPLTPDRVWDACVLGAGPAGALAARQLALAGRSVLVLERRRFPRPKVCGGCLGHVGVAALREAGIAPRRAAFGTTPLDRATLACGRTRVRLPLGERLAIDRAEFDAALADEATAAGAVLVHGVRAAVDAAGEGRRAVRCTTDDGARHTLHAKVVIVATGLGGVSLLPAPERPPLRVRSATRIGCGVVIADASDAYPPGELTMASSDEGLGYAGVVRLPDGRLDLAAALAPRGGAGQRPGDLIERLLRRSELPVPVGLAEAKWSAVPRLTQRPERLGAERVFFLGDTAGYVEPFTGEGIGWALRSALALAPIAARAADSWCPETLCEWQTEHRRAVGADQRRCRWVCDLVGGRFVAPAVLRTLRLAPWLARPFLRGIEGAPVAAPA